MPQTILNSAHLPRYVFSVGVLKGPNGRYFSYYDDYSYVVKMTAETWTNNSLLYIIRVKPKSATKEH